MESKGEAIIRHLLEREHYKFKQEVSFPDLKGFKNSVLRFDFKIDHPALGPCLVEFQGVQHYEYNQHFSKSKQKWRYAQQMDIRKASYCLLHKIPLFIIPYTDIGELKEASDIFQKKYRVKNKNHTMLNKPSKN